MLKMTDESDLLLFTDFLIGSCGKQAVNIAKN